MVGTRESMCFAVRNRLNFNTNDKYTLISHTTKILEHKNKDSNFKSRKKKYHRRQQSKCECWMSVSARARCLSEKWEAASEIENVDLSIRVTLSFAILQWKQTHRSRTKHSSRRRKQVEIQMTIKNENKMKSSIQFTELKLRYVGAVRSLPLVLIWFGMTCALRTVNERTIQLSFFFSKVRNYGGELNASTSSIKVWQWKSLTSWGTWLQSSLALFIRFVTFEWTDFLFFFFLVWCAPVPLTPKMIFDMKTGNEHTKYLNKNKCRFWHFWCDAGFFGIESWMKSK